MQQITEETGVDEELILKFIKQKRIQISQLPNLAYPCERCGNPIRTGKFCKSCQTDIESQLDHMNQKTAAEFKEKTVQKTHTMPIIPKTPDSLN